MSIPAFDAQGMLPPFTGANPTVSAQRSPYRCSMSELCSVLGTSEHRKRLLRNLIEYRTLIATGGYANGLQFIDGSFVEDIEHTESRNPNDIDVFSILIPPDPYRSDPKAWQLNCLAFWEQEIAAVAKNRERYSLDCYAFIPSFEDLGSFMERALYWYGLFSHKRVTHAWKGFVALPLNPADDQVALIALGAT